MREMADAMVASGLKGKGYEYINLSEVALNLKVILTPPCIFH
jgi:hypothetical protein